MNREGDLECQPVVRLVYQGSWVGGYLEPARRLYDHELVYVSAGRFRFELAGRRHTLTPGAVILIPPGLWHTSWTPPRGTVTRHCLHFDWTPVDFPASRPLAAYEGDRYDPTLISPIPREVRGLLPLITRVGRGSELGEMIDMMFRFFRRRHELGEAMLAPVLRTLRSEARSDLPPVRLGRTARAVLAIRDDIDRNYAAPLDYRRFCRQARLSPSHLCRAFTAIVGRPPRAYLAEVRLHHARRLLQSDERTIKEVGNAVGLPDANYFSRLFRRTFGRPPSAFRQ